MIWHLARKPWPVQLAYLNKAAGRSHFGNWAEMGLGKSAMVLNEFIDFASDVELCIVLAPSSFVADWPLLPDEWGITLKTGMWGKDQRLPYDWEYGLYAIAHETLRGSRRAREGLVSLMQNRRCMLVIDESTGIKNPQSLLAKFCIGELAKYAIKVRLTNGTPIVQNALDYYAQLRMLREFNGVNQWAFRNRFCIMGGFQGRQIKGIRNEDELSIILDRCSFRALKIDWRKDLPPQIYKPLHLEMTDTQATHYRTMMQEFYAVIDGATEVTADMVLTQRLKLQQISSCLLMKDGRGFWLEEPKNNPKLQAALEVAGNEYGKTIVTYQFRPSGDMLLEEFNKAGLQPAVITGGMQKDDLLEQKRRFNDDPNCRVLIGQIDQTSRGHTLIGQPGKDRCSRIFHFETSLSLMHYMQVNDRNHRGAQDEPCLIFNPVTSPIDEINFAILTRKRAQAAWMDELVAEVRRTGLKAVS